MRLKAVLQMKSETICLNVDVRRETWDVRRKELFIEVLIAKESKTVKRLTFLV